jgi:hypothetical protein
MEKRGLHQTAEDMRDWYQKLFVEIPEYGYAAGVRMFDQKKTGDPIKFSKSGVEFSVNPYSPTQQGNFLEVTTVKDDYRTTVLLYSNPSINGKDSPKGMLEYERQCIHLIADSELEKKEIYKFEAAKEPILDHLRFVEALALAHYSPEEANV